MLGNKPDKASSLDVFSFFKRNPRLVIIPVFFIACIFALSFFNGRFAGSGSPTGGPPHAGKPVGGRYAHQPNYLKYNKESTSYKIGIIADMDQDSKVAEGLWKSVFKEGTLHRDHRGQYSITWDAKHDVTTKLNEKGRGMELSELTNFNDRLLAYDDRTGLVFELLRHEADQTPFAIPRYILTNGDGLQEKGFKSEWATVKDDVVYVGSMGKEWVENNEIKNYYPMWVKTIDSTGHVEDVDWVHVYEKLRTVTRTSYPGYLLHEAVCWNPVQNRWFFLPRRVSTEMYNDVDDEVRGSNIMISCAENFSECSVTQVGVLNRKHGFSSFKFVPGRENEFVVLKTEEYRGTIHTYIAVFDLDGNVLLEESKIGDNTKYEGLEFL
eukprot:TRINITY_DN2793_c0_g1_i1.p1 TRINITY_DN2793_c0_g1~~TRINITY_DN2793_c0_g1_i1.p1  ORF type:complete len:410 (+),score=101.36 TRINITY_DN2793_c0_g1_i1:90-1232(+)